MTEIVSVLSPDEARSLTDQIKAHVAELLPLIKEAFERRADVALGYTNWLDYCDAELRGLRLPIERRREAVAELRQTGMSIPAIASAIGASVGTVHNDLKKQPFNSEKLPDRSVGLDGKERPAARPSSSLVEAVADAIEKTAERVAEPQAEPFAAAVADFPELNHFAAKPAQAVEIATQLRGMDEPERETRRENLARFIAADAEGRLDKLRRPDAAEAAMRRADQVFDAINQAAQEVRKLGAEEVLADAVAYADPMELEAWRSQFTEMSVLCGALADACQVKLRRVQ